MNTSEIPNNPYCGHQSAGWSPTASNLSLRDYIATHALAGMLAGEPGTHLNFENATRDAYMYADAMLAARAVKP